MVSRPSHESLHVVVYTRPVRSQGGGGSPTKGLCVVAQRPSLPTPSFPSSPPSDALRICHGISAPPEPRSVLGGGALPNVYGSVYFDGLRTCSTSSGNRFMFSFSRSRQAFEAVVRESIVSAQEPVGVGFGRIRTSRGGEGGVGIGVWTYAGASWRRPTRVQRSSGPSCSNRKFVVEPAFCARAVPGRRRSPLPGRDVASSAVAGPTIPRTCARPR